MMAPMRVSRTLRCLLLAGPLFAGLTLITGAARPAAAWPADETLFADVDLLGWQRAGVLTLSVPPLADGTPEALIDGDPHTRVHLSGTDSALVALRLQPELAVRRVVVTTAGEDPAVVSLIVVEPGGQRFQAGEFEVSGGQQAAFQLRDVQATELQVLVEGDDPALGVHLADIAVHARLQIVGLVLQDVPDTLPAGGEFPWRVLGRDSLGGRPDLTDHARLVVTPARALTFLPDHRAVTRVQGVLTIQPRLEDLAGTPRTVTVQPLDPAPQAPRAVAGLRTVELHLHGTPPFEVFRRHTGEKTEIALGRTETQVFHDDSVAPANAYVYTARRVDNFDNPLSERSPEARARTLARLPQGWIDIGRVPVLLVLFTDSLPEGARASIVESCEAARLFVFRHSLGRIVLDLTLLDVPGPTPITSGPTMLGIEQRLRQLGIRDDQFGVVYAIAGDLVGDYGGFQLLGRTAGAMGRGRPVPTPPGALGPDPAAAWGFVHELQHVLASLLAPFELQPSGHFPEDLDTLGTLGTWRGRPFDAGEAWDAHAWLLADLAGWQRLGPPWRRPLEVLDSDGDGLPDADARLPLDELRAGSDPDLADTDADGLDDLAETASGLYGGTDPLQPDTDGDGVPDGEDPWPLSDFAGVIHWGAQPQLLARLPNAARPDAPPMELSASWTSATLTLCVTSTGPFDVFVDLDGSGRTGRWESDVGIAGADPPASDVWCGEARLALRANAPPRGVYVGGRAVPGARLSSDRLDDGRTRVTAVLPRRLGPGATDVRIPPDAPTVEGLRLARGTVLGLAITLRASNLDDPEPFEAFPADGGWFSVFETHRLMDAELVD
jgi:hypothetical protein